MIPRLLLAALVVAQVSCTGRYVRPTTDVKVEATEARLERGAYLVNHVMACGVCHDTYEDGDLVKQRVPGGELAGGNLLVEHGMKVFMPNITPHKETGVGLWTDDELIRAIRDGVNRDGKLMFPMMPFDAYQTLSDEDVKAVVAYLRTVEPKPQPRPTQKSTAPFPLGLAISIGATHHKPVTSVPEPDRENKVAYGEYLVRAGHCYICHSLTSRGPRSADDPKYMAGADMEHDLPGLGKVWARNLTPDVETGIGGYTDEQIKTALRVGMRLDGKPMAPPMAPFAPHLAGVLDEDLDAMIAYLRSLKPVKNKVPERQLLPEAQATYGG